MSVPTSWPALPLADWRDTKETLHLWLQVVGKVRLALAPPQNHWWHAALYVTARGLTTSPMPYGGGAVEARFDFLDHALVLETSAGEVRRIALAPRSVADFYRAVMAALADFGVAAAIYPRPVEIPGEVVPFEADETHAAYDADAAQRFWRVLLDAQRVMARFRGRFLGKASPVHLWWGGMDLACTRFSGATAPRHPGGIPNCPDYVAVEGYSHACISAGWWPGDGASDAAFYAYAYPEPAGLPEARVGPAEARYDATLREFILPYAAVRGAADPDAEVTDFLQTTYASAADLAGWHRAALERGSPSVAIV